MPVRLFAPLRAKITSSAQPLVPPSGRPSQGSSLSILTEPRDELAPFHTRSPRRRFSRNGTLWNIGTVFGNQSGFAPENFTTFAHFSVSSAMNLPNSAGDIGIGTPPRSASRALIVGSGRPALIASLSLLTISAGVPVGAPTPYQPLDS